jgi:DNA-directed RNA polymerase specialized sigma24 family protein
MNTNLYTLIHRLEVTRAIQGALLANAWETDLEAGVEAVRTKVLAAFERGVRLPTHLDGMRSFASILARNHAIETRRATERTLGVVLGPRNPELFVALIDGCAMRDPVDARRQLEVLAELFRAGEMPEDGADILEAVGSECTFAEIAEDLGITREEVRHRLKKMRRIYRKRMLGRGLWPGGDHLRLVASNPPTARSKRRTG